LAQSGEGGNHLDRVDRANIEANDIAFGIGNPGQEKFWVLVEKVDPVTGEMIIIRSDIVVGTSLNGNINAKDIERAYDSLGRDKFGTVVAEGHTHPVNVGVSRDDVVRARNLATGGARFYMGMPNRNVYLVDPFKDLPGNRNLRPWERSRFQHQIR
jgi:hypothetical protein